MAVTAEGGSSRLGDLAAPDKPVSLLSKYFHLVWHFGNINWSMVRFTTIVNKFPISGFGVTTKVTLSTNYPQPFGLLILKYGKFLH